MTATDDLMLLRAALESVRSDVNDGICSQLDDYCYEALRVAGKPLENYNWRLHVQLMQGWPGYSGDPAYPVPSATDATSAETAFYSAFNANTLWRGDHYAEARKSLLAYLADAARHLDTSLTVSEKELAEVKESLKRRLLRLQKDVQAGKAPVFGICYQIYNGGGNLLESRLLTGLMHSWKGHSGNWRYPVPVPDSENLDPCSSIVNAELYYRENETRTFVGEYGESRMQLLQHCIDTVDAAPNLWGRPYPPALQVSSCQDMQFDPKAS